MTETALNLTSNRKRYLDRLMGADTTDDELEEMWQDRHPRDREFDNECNFSTDMKIFFPLEQHDFDMWRAKMRALNGQLSGVLDGIAICREHSLVLPNWVSEKSSAYLAYLARPSDEIQNAQFQREIRKEKTLLAKQQRASLLDKIYRNHKFYSCYAGHPPLLKYPERILGMAKDELVELFPRRMTQDKASEIAELWLRGTWAEAEADSILISYKNAKGNLKLLLGTEELTDIQSEFLAFDLQFIRPETLKALGCPLVTLTPQDQ